MTGGGAGLSYFFFLKRSYPSSSSSKRAPFFLAAPGEATFSTFFGCGFGSYFLTTAGNGIFSLLIGYVGLGSYFLAGKGKDLIYTISSFLVSWMTFIGEPTVSFCD